MIQEGRNRLEGDWGKANGMMVYSDESTCYQVYNHHIKKRIDERKGFDTYRRFEALPSYERMVFQIWKPLSSYEKPLSYYYDSN